MGLTLLAAASMPTTFWGEAFTTAAKLINILPTPVLNGLSPTEKLLGKKPSYDSLRVFGCLCFPHQRVYNKHKLAFRSSPCTFIGYSTTHKGYKCLTQQGKVIITPHVVFFEDSFPFQQKEKKVNNAHDSDAPTPTVPTISRIPRPNEALQQQQHHQSLGLSSRIED